MAETTEIAWADSTFNGWSGCTKVSPACTNCYAEKMCARFSHLGEWGPGAERKRTSKANWRKPVAWNRKAEKAQDARDLFNECGGSDCRWEGPIPRRPRVFCGSLCDWLDPEVPAEWLADLLALIAATPHLDWLLLSKRPELWRDRLWLVTELRDAINPRDPDLAQEWLSGKAPPNVWMGITAENQEWLDKRWESLKEIPARIKFLSVEPMLGPLVLPDDFPGCYHPTSEGLAPDHSECAPTGTWVIGGGESGSRARPTHPAWARSLRDQCREGGIPFMWKQHGEFAPCTSPVLHACMKGKKDWQARLGFPKVCACSEGPHTLVDDAKGFACVHRVGKKAAGRLLDGQLHNEFPEVARG